MYVLSSHLSFRRIPAKLSKQPAKSDGTLHPETSESLRATCLSLPNLTRVTTDPFSLPQPLRGRPVNNVTLRGRSLDLSPLTLSTVTTQKLAISYTCLYPQPEPLLGSLFPSLTHLYMTILGRLPYGKRYAYLPFYLFRVSHRVSGLS
jgi:hypothetical protein